MRVEKVETTVYKIGDKTVEFLQQKGGIKLYISDNVMYVCDPGDVIQFEILVTEDNRLFYYE